MQGLTKIKDFAKRIGTAKLCAAGAVCAAAVVITTAFVLNKPNENGGAVEASSQAADSQAVTSQTGNFSVVTFRKAPLCDYDMAQTFIGQSSGEKANEDINEEAGTGTAEFTVRPEDKNFSYSDNIPAPSGLYAARDTSSEFFTVRDITTGKTVTMNAFELVCAIVYNEIGDGWGTEAIKAQAVAAYSCLRYSDSIGMLETVGIKMNYTPKIESCVRAVQGQVVNYKGNIANTLYSASTAGYTIPSGDVITSRYPYLTCVKSAYDYKDPNWGRKTSFTQQQVKSKLEQRFRITLSDNLKNWFRITDSRYGKYIFGLSVDSKAKAAGKEIAALFGLRSNAFDISYANGKFTFTTYGWGHGVGMSQWGACMYARNGYSYDQILRHYYPGTSIGLSKVSRMAVDRGKKSEEELKREAETAKQTTPQSVQPPEKTSDGQQQTQPQQTTAAEASGQPDEQTTAQTTAESSAEQSEKPSEKVTKSVGMTE